VSKSARHLRLVPSTDTHDALDESPSNSPPAGTATDSDLIRRLARVDLVCLDAHIWRHLIPQEQPRPDSGVGAIRTGGRFNPPGSFAVVYGSLTLSGAGAEFRKLARRHPIGIDNHLPRHLYRSTIKSESVLNLQDSVIRNALGMPQEQSASVHRAYTQLIGELARALGISVILGPGATHETTMIAVFSGLVSAPRLDFRHIDIWRTMADVPGMLNN
jgi:RES domain-containing protein